MPCSCSIIGDSSILICDVLLGYSESKSPPLLSHPAENHPSVVWLDLCPGPELIYDGDRLLPDFSHLSHPCDACSASLVHPLHQRILLSHLHYGIPGGDCQRTGLHPHDQNPTSSPHLLPLLPSPPEISGTHLHGRSHGDFHPNLVGWRSIPGFSCPTDPSLAPPRPLQTIRSPPSSSRPSGCAVPQHQIFGSPLFKECTSRLE
uniref:Uncharacterized protein n=1 Tax=Setaria viridis TaxID=4556 RepID=A0A4V6D8J3_SETVI|nr:hypothetical protein SEVIR_4G223101v2 [Setaria viridis]